MGAAVKNAAEPTETFPRAEKYSVFPMERSDTVEPRKFER